MPLGIIQKNFRCVKRIIGYALHFLMRSNEAAFSFVLGKSMLEKKYFIFCSQVKFRSDFQSSICKIKLKHAGFDLTKAVNSLSEALL